MVRVKMLELFGPCEELVRLGKGRAQREAYVLFMDLLVVFSRALRRNPQLASLVYVPEISLQRTLQVKPSSGNATQNGVYITYNLHFSSSSQPRLFSQPFVSLSSLFLTSYPPHYPPSSRTM